MMMMMMLMTVLMMTLIMLMMMLMMMTLAMVMKMLTLKIRSNGTKNLTTPVVANLSSDGDVSFGNGGDISFPASEAAPIGYGDVATGTITVKLNAATATAQVLTLTIDFPQVGDTADEDEPPVAIAAVGKALVGIDFQPDARMAERGVGKAVAGAVAGDAGFRGADGFGRGLGHRSRP